MRTCWHNRTFVPEDQAHVSIFDRGLLFGDGVYEVAAVLNGRLLDADLHLARLTRSLAAIEIPMTVSVEEWLVVMQELADKNDVAEGLVYLQVTRGVAERDFPFPTNVTPTTFAYARPKALTHDANASGVRVLSVPDIRWARRDIKSTSLLAQVLAKQAARSAGAFEALMHEDGTITEGGASTFWIVRDGTIITRPLSNDILAGITRDVTLALASAAHIPIVERPITLDEVRSADECFLSSATSFVLPVTQVDDHVVGNGEAGVLTRQLRALYFARAASLSATER
jgi:D-alanine transaminase